jgi:hypothetical protein
MNNGAFVNLNGATAAEICARFDINQEARALLGDGLGPRALVEALLANKLYIAGIDFIAHALRPREAIWWGCLCLQQACGSDLSSLDKAACKAAVQWVLEPTEENRAAARAPAEAAGYTSLAGALAWAVNQTGGNLVPPKASQTSPRPFASAKTVANTIKLASVKSDPAKIADTQRLFGELGIGVAEGRFLVPGCRNGAPVRRSE